MIRKVHLKTHSKQGRWFGSELSLSQKLDFESPRKTFPSVYHLSDPQEEVPASQHDPALRVLFIFSPRLVSISHSKSCLTHGHYSCLVLCVRWLVAKKKSIYQDLAGYSNTRQHCSPPTAALVQTIWILDVFLRQQSNKI